MSVDALAPNTALVVIDLQQSITALPTVSPADAVVEQAARLTDAFRRRGLPVVLVNVGLSTDGGEALRARVDAPAAPRPRDPQAMALRAELGAGEHDIRIAKRNWDAFVGTELDVQLRRRGVSAIVLAGISTSIGVESTARTAYALGYEVVVATDAVTDLNAQAQDASLRVILPRIARLDDTDAVLDALPTGA
jgi:nicotinamidase-related amidase